MKSLTVQMRGLRLREEPQPVTVIVLAANLGPCTCRLGNGNSIFPVTLVTHNVITLHFSLTSTPTSHSPSSAAFKGDPESDHLLPRLCWASDPSCHHHSSTRVPQLTCPLPLVLTSPAPPLSQLGSAEHPDQSLRKHCV